MNLSHLLFAAPEPTFQMPLAMTAAATEIDDVYYAMYWFSLVFTVAITAATLYFVIKYKRKKGDVLDTPGNYTVLEITWTVIPILFIVVLFHIGFKSYIANAVAPEGSMEVRVRGERWKWEFEYPNGMRENGVLMVPVNKPVKLILSSSDVIHSFFVPAFRMKKDAVPGMYSTIAFEPNAVGDAQVFCAEYCGTSHSGMLATIKVVDQKTFDDYLKEGPKNPFEGEGAAEKWGEKLFLQNNCNTCHSRDGSKSPGPTFKGVFGRHEMMEGGAGLDIDDNYLKESIQKPQAKIVMGYTQVQMPQFSLSERQVDALIAYLKTIK